MCRVTPFAQASFNLAPYWRTTIYNCSGMALAFHVHWLQPSTSMGLSAKRGYTNVYIGIESVVCRGLSARLRRETLHYRYNKSLPACCRAGRLNSNRLKMEIPILLN